MAINEYVPFAAGSGANALTPSAYAADPARQAGVQAGTARSILANAAWRQSSSVAAAFGQFIVEYANLSALDDGDIETLVNSFVVGLRTVAAGAVNVPPAVALWHYGVDTGQPGAIVANVSPDINGYAEGFVYSIRANNSSVTGGTTANLDGRGNRTVTRADGTPIKQGDYFVGEVITLIDDGSRLQLSGLLTSNLPASSSQLFTASGLFTPPAGVQRAFVQVWGAGGGGGGAGSSSAAGNGGGPGGYAEGYVGVVPGVPIAVTVGASGPAGTAGGGDGAGGGTSSFGSMISATGGAGGRGSPSGIVVANAAFGMGFGGSFQWSGIVGQFGYAVGGVFFGGTNGAGYQASINPPGANSPGGAGGGAGSGGSGASNNAPGGAGAAGQVRVSY